MPTPDGFDEDAPTSLMPDRAIDDDAPTTLIPPEPDGAPARVVPVQGELPSLTAAKNGMTSAVPSDVPATRGPPAQITSGPPRRVALPLLTVSFALVITALVVLLIGSFVLSLVAERAIATADWGLQTVDPGVYTLSEAELNEGAQTAVQAYALGPVEDIQIDLRSPDTAVVELALSSMSVSLAARFETREGIPVVSLDHLNDVPLPIVGGIVSGGINRGFESVWQDSSLRITSIVFEDREVVIHMEHE
jgi:hypothetical protein